MSSFLKKQLKIIRPFAGIHGVREIRRMSKTIPIQLFKVQTRERFISLLHKMYYAFKCLAMANNNNNEHEANRILSFVVHISH